jgi:hypothetical protein
VPEPRLVVGGRGPCQSGWLAAGRREDTLAPVDPIRVVVVQGRQLRAYGVRVRELGARWPLGEQADGLLAGVVAARDLPREMQGGDGEPDQCRALPAAVADGLPRAGIATSSSDQDGPPI